MSQFKTKPVVVVKDLSKSFKLPHEQHSGIKQLLVNRLKGKKGYEIQHVLSDISFEIKKGEFFGIVGRNGSGKSTLLKLLADIYTPNSGSVQINGSLTPFIELGVGFNPELTGRENIFLNGALLGLSRLEVEAMYDDIVEFAELEKFMDQKLKNYSSGMQVRLAFSIAIRAKSDVLLIDEVLAVGDTAFQQKCYNYFNDLKRQSQTVILVTHDMGAVRRFCNRGLLLNKGKIQIIGKPDLIAREYEKLNTQQAEVRLEKSNKEKHYKKREGNGLAVIDKVETFNSISGQSQNTFSPEEKIGVRITYKAEADIKSPAVGYIFQNNNDITVFATNNIVNDLSINDIKKGSYLILESIVDNIFTDDEYSITCAIESKDLNVIYDRIEYIHRFLIGGHQLSHATTHPEHTFAIKESSSDK